MDNSIIDELQKSKVEITEYIDLKNKKVVNMNI